MGDSTLLAWALDRIRAEYAKALQTPHIRNPLAYALYQVWREVDSNGKEI